MPSAAGQLVPTNLGAILLAIQAQVMASMSFPQERVILWAREEESWHPQGDQVVRIRPRMQLPEGTLIGSGRVGQTLWRTTRTINVCLWCRWNVDQFDNDQTWLTDTTNGFCAMETALVNALFNFHGTDSGGGSGILFEPLKMGPVASPSKPRTEPDWGKSEADFECTYLMSLATNYV